MTLGTNKMERFPVLIRSKHTKDTLLRTHRDIQKRHQPPFYPAQNIIFNVETSSKLHESITSQ
jgi:hypothetical protein